MTYTLYRHFNSEGRLLYIGMTTDLGRRLHQHARGSTWFPLVASSTYQHFDNIDSLLDAERESIRSESPLHNVQYNRAVNTHPGLPTARTTNGRRQLYVLIRYGQFAHDATEVRSAEFAEFAWSARDTRLFAGISQQMFRTLITRVLGPTVPLLRGKGWTGEQHNKNLELAELAPDVK